jgi:hypothetical protein
MKNVTVDAAIIPQVLQYAFWAESNPDSIKSLWLELEEKPEDIAISWDDFEVRIIVIAPRILPSTLDIVEKINYQVDLIEINRWVDGENQLLLVKKLESEEKKQKAKPVSGLATYNKDFYEGHYNKESVKIFFDFIEETEQIIRTSDWPLETKYNKHYVGFKVGFFNLFGIHWIGTKTLAFFFKITESEAKKFSTPMTRYDKQFKQAYFYIDPKKTKASDLKDIFSYTYKKFAGEGK